MIPDQTVAGIDAKNDAKACMGDDEPVPGRHPLLPQLAHPSACPCLPPTMPTNSAQQTLCPAPNPIKRTRMRPHRRQRRRIRAEPLRQFGVDLIRCRRRQPHAPADVVRPAQRQVGHATQELADVRAAPPTTTK